MSWSMDALDEQTTLLTVNNRLATDLRLRYDQQQLAQGRKVWPSADILPWNAWLTRQYTLLLDAGLSGLDLLTPAQERLLWQRVIESRHADNPPLMDPRAAADQARAAHALVCDWQLAAHDIQQPGAETQVFLRWQRAFTRLLAKHQLVSSAQLVAQIDAAFARAALPTPTRLVLSGFDALTPAQTALLNTLEAAGCEITEHSPARIDAERMRIEASDNETEIHQAAAWARDRLAQQPDARLAIVSPQIARQRRDIERILTTVLAPHAYLSDTHAARPFNISLGEPLTQRPMIAHALLALHSTHGERPLHDIGLLLRSAFLGGHAEEWENRALLDAALRQDGMPRISLHRLRMRIARFDQNDPRHCTDLGARLDRLFDLIQALPGRTTPSQWVGHLRAVLGALGWPGDRPLDSREYQEHERMQRVFSELATLGKVRSEMTYAAALQSLVDLCGDAVFQAQSAAAPIQVLGPLEAAGMTFDAIWLMGLDDQTWPPTPQPNPLLPVGLQRTLNMPHASAARELAFASQLTERLAGAAPLVVASHAGNDGDRELRASALIADWPLAASPPLPDETLLRACAASGALQELPAATNVQSSRNLQGGAALLGAQANCPFQANARFRLDARPLEEAQHAPDGALLGSIVHELLQRVWQRLGDSRTLASKDAASLRGLVEPLAAATLEDVGRRRPDLFGDRFKALETERLTELVVAWLESERQRTQAFRVIALEQDETIELQGLKLRTRADRVDQLADGSLAIVDYKTGRNVRIDGWTDPRLSEPQLPLYSTGHDGDVSAALLARVRSGKPGCGFVGLSRTSDFAPGVVTADEFDAAGDWERLQAGWRHALTTLADEIIAGRIVPTPSVEACRYCAFDALCRVDEMLDEEDREGTDGF